jgi:hypothetical protein
MVMTPAQLLAIATDLSGRLPANAQLTRTEVGNLSLFVDGKYVGFVDLKSGKISMIQSWS